MGRENDKVDVSINIVSIPTFYIMTLIMDNSRKCSNQQAAHWPKSTYLDVEEAQGEDEVATVFMYN